MQIEDPNTAQQNKRRGSFKFEPKTALITFKRSEIFFDNRKSIMLNLRTMNEQ